MDSKCKYWMLLLTLLCVISLGFSLFRVFPCEVGNETFLGIVLSAVGIIVTLVMGYQIFSVVEFRGELQKQKEENIKLAHDNAKLQQMIRNQMGALDKQKGRIEEGLNMCFSYINYFFLSLCHFLPILWCFSQRNEYFCGRNLLLSIDDEDMTNKEVSYVSDHLRGDPGSSFMLKVKRPSTGKTMKVKVTRRTIQLPFLPYYGMLEGSIGYINFNSFTEQSAKEVRRAFIDLRKQGEQYSFHCYLI
jgi:hypothetical protein